MKVRSRKRRTELANDLLLHSGVLGARIGTIRTDIQNVSTVGRYRAPVPSGRSGGRLRPLAGRWRGRSHGSRRHARAPRAASHCCSSPGAERSHADFSAIAETRSSHHRNCAVGSFAARRRSRPSQNRANKLRLRPRHDRGHEVRPQAEIDEASGA